MWVEIINVGYEKEVLPSSSSWGCELKFWNGLGVFIKDGHPPREDVSWNTRIGWSDRLTARSSSSWGCELKCWYHHRVLYRNSHPPREDVSWNSLDCLQEIGNSCHPPREDVSWNMTSSKIISCFFSHPPREDVSWNTHVNVCFFMRLTSSSSWGCELKCLHLR